MDFPLSSVDLDEGVIRWDYGQPYMIRQRASDGFCVHNDPTTHGCTVHAQRPAACRRYDCRKDERVWIDYERRIPAPLGTPGDGLHDVESFDLMERVKMRAAAEAIESNAVSRVYADDEPHEGPALTPRPPRAPR
jgi:Fe-S-cluster containining protein